MFYLGIALVAALALGWFNHERGEIARGELKNVKIELAAAVAANNKTREDLGALKLQYKASQDLVDQMGKDTQVAIGKAAKSKDRHDRLVPQYKAQVDSMIAASKERELTGAEQATAAMLGFPDLRKRLRETPK